MALGARCRAQGDSSGEHRARGLHRPSRPAGTAGASSPRSPIRPPTCGGRLLLDRQVEDRDVAGRRRCRLSRALAPRPLAGADRCSICPAAGRGDGLWRSEDGQASEMSKGGGRRLVRAARPYRATEAVTIVVSQGREAAGGPSSADGRRSRTLDASARDRRDQVGQSAADWSPDGSWLSSAASDTQGAGLFKSPG